MHSKMHAYIMRPHPWPVLVVLIATAAFGWLAAGGAPNPTRYALLLAGMLGGQLAIGALNELTSSRIRSGTWMSKSVSTTLSLRRSTTR